MQILFANTFADRAERNVFFSRIGVSSKMRAWDLIRLKLKHNMHKIRISGEIDCWKERTTKSRNYFSRVNTTNSFCLRSRVFNTGWNLKSRRADLGTWMEVAAIDRK